MRAFLVVLAFAVTGSSAACGGVDPLPPPPPPPPAMPTAPVASAKNHDGTPVSTPPAPVLLVAGAPAPEPAGPPPQVHIVAPSRALVIAAAKAADFIMKLDVKNWPVAPASGHVHVLLDGRVTRTVTDIKEPLKIGALAGAPLTEGQHVLAAVLSRGSEESLKSKDATALAEFYVAKNIAGAVDLKQPYLVVTKPDAAYADNDADHVLVDFLAFGANLGEASQAKQSIALRLEGPGVEGSLTATTTRVVPYYLENLRAGVYTLRLEILGPDGKPLPTPGATSSRTVTVKRSIRTEEPKGPTGDAGADAGVANPAMSLDPSGATPLDAGRADAAPSNAHDGGLPKIPPPPLKTKPVIEKPKPPTRR